jgi:ureidoglycolate lyase
LVQISVKELTLESFSLYGTYAVMINPSAPKIGAEPVEFFRDMAQLNLGQSAIASFSVCRVLKRPFIVDVTEMHRCCGEGILPLDADVIIHVGLATPNGEIPLDKIEAFHIPKGTFVALRRGVWHHAPFTADEGCANVLIVLPERTYADDCFVYEIPEDRKIEIR